MNNSNKKILYISSFMVTVVLILVSILLIHSYNNNKRKELYETYGIVKHVYADSIVIEDPNTKKETTLIKESDDEYNVGDLLYIQAEGNKIKSHQIVVDDYGNKLTATTTTTTTHCNTTDTTTTTVVTTTTIRTTTSKANTTTVTTTTTTKYVDKDEMILEYISEEKDNIEKTSIKDKAKQAFISIVDFIFYDGTIKGVKFSELKASTKAKVVYYALLIDSGIESKFPNYKEDIGDKYQDIKGKLVAEFLELKYEVCSKSPDACEQAKADLAILKKSLNLTWDVIKDVFKYIKDLTLPKIQSWYESFRG